MTNLAILGAGRIAGTMAETVRRMNEAGQGDICLYAVAARDAGRAQAFAEANGVQKSFGSYEEMVRDPGVDLVYIATPHSHHAEHMRLCIEHGKAVLCEKAFTANAAQAEEISLDALRSQLAQAQESLEALNASIEEKSG